MTEVSAPSIVSFARAEPETTISKPAPDRLLQGDPEQVTRNYFTDPTGRFFAGTWQSTRGRWRVRFTEHEFCHITEGRVRIEDDRGNAWTFGPGDSFVVPAGFSGTWDVLESMKKMYVIYEPAAS